MRFVPLELEGSYLVELERYQDERGFFARTWDGDEFAAHGLAAEVVQSSISRSTSAGTLRGMHFQLPPHEETKLVRCTRGTVYDVIVDLRPESATYKRWVGVELDADCATALYVPKGFAHGFQTLVDDTEILYVMSTPYVAEASTGIRWDDPAFGIAWPTTEQRTINARDLAWPDYRSGSVASSTSRADGCEPR